MDQFQHILGNCLKISKMIIVMSVFGVFCAIIIGRYVYVRYCNLKVYDCPLVKG